MSEGKGPRYAHAEVAHVAAHFDRLVERYGNTHQALDYGSRKSQRIRFDVLASGLTLADRRVLDVGCGMADLKSYLDERGIACTYSGMDASSRMIAEARKRHADTEFSAGDFLAPEMGAPCDVAVANGIFYLLGERAEELQREIIERKWSLADEAVAFSSLSSWAPERSEGEYHSDPSVVLRFCRKLTPWVRLRHDYLPHDFTIFMYKRAMDA